MIQWTTSASVSVSVDTEYNLTYNVIVEYTMAYCITQKYILLPHQTHQIHEKELETMCVQQGQVVHVTLAHTRPAAAKLNFFTGIMQYWMWFCKQLSKAYATETSCCQLLLVGSAHKCLSISFKYLSQCNEPLHYQQIWLFAGVKCIDHFHNDVTISCSFYGRQKTLALPLFR